MFNIEKNRKAAKLSALSSAKIDEYFTGEETLPLDQSEMVEQTKFTHSTWWNVFLKQTKTIGDQRNKKSGNFAIFKP